MVTVETLQQIDLSLHRLPWCQGHLFEYDWPEIYRSRDEVDEHVTGACLLGHVVLCVDGRDRSHPRSPETVRIEKIFCDVAEDLYPDRVEPGEVYTLPHFNDHPETTLNDVFRVVREATRREGAHDVAPEE